MVDFGPDACSELDAISLGILRALIVSSIESNIDGAAWMRVRHEERLERETLESLVTAGFVPGERYAIREAAA